MMKRSAWPWILVMVLLVSWFEPAPCTAQTQPQLPSTNPAAGVSIPPPRQFQPPSGSTSPGSPVSPAPLPAPSGVRAPNESAPPTASALAPMAGDLSLRLKPAPLEKADLRFPINLATALRLADARPLIVAAAQASVWVAEAQLTRAKVLWVPQLNFGGDYLRHDGGGPDFNKGIMTAPSVNFFYGGAGMWQNVALTDAFFQPLVSRQVLSARQFDIQTAKNDALQMTADAYFQVHQHRGRFAGSLYCVERGHDLIERIAQLSREFVSVVEVDRARNLVADLEQQATMSRQEWRVQSANLTQVLRLDPRAVVYPMESDHLQLTLIDPARPLDDLIPVALTNRPELASNQATVQAVAATIRRERGACSCPAS